MFTIHYLTPDLLHLSHPFNLTAVFYVFGAATRRCNKVQLLIYIVLYTSTCFDILMISKL
nr:MAG TPA: hypothetical protein [Bacteriophage sp.]